ncbi:DUF2482 family protein [Staphylococcus aureus]|uniref:DUF2482 family protein n=1 Tax=Staphylococcus aureus TaxID=1280 RepID=UPI000452F297|nr:DUF2482 family protein [Staphylococcus aureus]EUV83511.1 hypothetical protein O390_02602 [Staphylococcus aureus M0236]MBZ5273656.1 DUF2482 family protein [Staphylococcus aureus]MCD0538041.1 DUF2482 family protein [Staphylococcus aureus]HCZ8370352.1 DUF2482 family protein [Staphylococcus aureus]HCZ8819734.1 DUF2482 family protein [Staphylococcus aureus]
MTKNYKDMTQDELRGLLGEKTSELYDLAKEIKRESKFDILFFSAIGVSDGDFIKSSSSALGNAFNLAELLDNATNFDDVINAIQKRKLQKFLAIDNNEEG